jgi:hypothetical protein
MGPNLGIFIGQGSRLWQRRNHFTHSGALRARALTAKLGVHSRAEAVESARTLACSRRPHALPQRVMHDNFEPNGPWFTALAPV